MNRKREAVSMGIGILAGLALSGPTVQAANHLTATISTQTFYVNGQQVQFEAYTIHGNNFVKLRDIGKTVDFGVEYDAATNSVYINPSAHYRDEIAQSSAIAEENVQAAIQALRDTYPTGTYYGAFYRSTSNGPYGMAPTHCAGWATLCSDAAFGNLPWRKIANPRWEDIRAGDLIRYDNDYGGHVVVVLERIDDYIKITDSGTSNKVYWGGQYFRWWLEQQSGYACYTRYPQ